MSAHSIAIVCHKGGAGKTTTVYNVAAFLSKMSCRTLVIDLDPQANLTIAYRLREDQLPCTVADLFMRRASLREVLVTGVIPSVDLAPASTTLTAAIEQTPYQRKEEILNQVITPEILGSYDYILFDTPRADSLPTINALVASDSVLVPFTPDYFGLSGIKQIFDIINDVKHTSYRNPDLTTLGLVVMRYSETATCRRSLSELRDTPYRDYLFDATVHESARVPGSITMGKPLAFSSPTFQAHRDYRALTEELIRKVPLVAA